MATFTEDWNASQFWYNETTATTLAEQLLDGASNDTNIAIVSAPSVYVALRNLLADSKRYSIKPTIKLLEYDERFAVFKKDFVFFDFQQPIRLDSELKGRFDCIVCDPPFLSEDCQTKAAMTVRWLARRWAGSTAAGDQGVKLMLCTGERMEALAHKLYGKAGLRTTTFLPEHTKGLSNEFRCYANFPCDAWSFDETK